METFSVHPRDGADEQLVTVVERDLSVHNSATEQRQVVRGAQEVAEIQQQLEICEHVGESPTLLAHSVDRGKTNKGI